MELARHVGSVRTYRLVDENTRAPMQRSVSSAGRSKGFDASGLDADTVRWLLVRVRWD